MASEIQDITMPLREMKERSLSYGLRPLIRESPDEGSSGKSTHDEQYYPQLDSDDVVGIDSKRRDLVTALVEGASTLTMIPLVGWVDLEKQLLQE